MNSCFLVYQRPRFNASGNKKTGYAPKGRPGAPVHIEQNVPGASLNFRVKRAMIRLWISFSIAWEMC